MTKSRLEGRERKKAKRAKKVKVPIVPVGPFRLPYLGRQQKDSERERRAVKNRRIYKKEKISLSIQSCCPSRSIQSISFTPSIQSISSMPSTPSSFFEIDQSMPSIPSMATIIIQKKRKSYACTSVKNDVGGSQEKFSWIPRKEGSQGSRRFPRFPIFR